jgi:hypothetical protein
VTMEGGSDSHSRFAAVGLRSGLLTASCNNPGLFKRKSSIDVFESPICARVTTIGSAAAAAVAAVSALQFVLCS